MDPKTDRQKCKSLEKTLLLLTEEISNLAKHLEQQQGNLSSVSNDYIREVQELLDVKDSQIQRLKKALTEMDTQKLESSQ